MAISEPEIIRPENLLQLKMVSEPQVSPDGILIAYVVTEVDVTTNSYIANIWIVNTQSGKSWPLTRGGQRDILPRWSPDGKWIAFLSNRDEEMFHLYMITSLGEELQRLTPLKLSCKPVVWSPDGKYLAFTVNKKDNKPEISRERICLTAHSPKVVTRAHFKMDGKGYTQDENSNLFIVSIYGGDTIQLTRGDYEDFAPSWSPDGNKIAFCRKRNGAADFNLSDVWVIDVKGEKSQQLTATLNHAISPSWALDGVKIAFYGTNEKALGLEESLFGVWLVPALGGLPQCLTEGYDHGVILYPRPAVTPGPVWSSDNTYLSFTVADKGNIHLKCVSALDSEITSVVGGARQITSYSAAAGRIAFCATDSENPSNIYTCTSDGRNEKQLTSINKSVLENLCLPKIERRLFDSPNGKIIDGWLMLPRDKSFPLPLLLDIHGGPHGFVGSYFSLSHFYRYVLASRGYAVLTINPSGSASYGKEFAHSIRGHWGECDMAEHLAAVDALIAEGIVDNERLAVAGYSYGGYMSAWLIGHTDRFKAAIIGAPITNLESFFGTSDIGMWYTSWEMGGTITEKQDVYRRLSPVNYADCVTTPTLILHGEQDERCPIGQSEELFTRLMVADKVTVEFVRYPGASHLFPSNGLPSHRLDYNQRVVDWVEQYTK